MNRYRRTEPHNRGLGVVNDENNGANNDNMRVNGDLIGVGAYARVYRGIDSWTNTEVALKILNCGEPGEGIMPTTLREITILRRLNHENIIRLLDVVQGSVEDISQAVNGSKIMLVLEFVEMDLKQFLSQHSEALPMRLVKSFTRQILAGLAHCHGVGIMHRDLKPQNILIGTRTSQGTDEVEYIVKLADFGLSRTYGFSPRPLTTLVVTLWYRAPELLLGCDMYDKTVDVWSVGCIFLELAHPNKAVAFPGINTLDQLFKIFMLLGTPYPSSPSPSHPGYAYPELLWPDISRYPYYSVSYPQWPPRAWDVIAPRLDEDGHDLLARMLSYSPSTRIHAAAALQQPYFEPVSPPSTPSTSPEATSAGNSFCLSPIGTTASGLIGATPNPVHEATSHQMIPIPWPSRSSSSLGCTSDEASETSSDPRAESVELILQQPPKRSRRGVL